MERNASFIQTSDTQLPISAPYIAKKKKKKKKKKNVIWKGSGGVVTELMRKFKWCNFIFCTILLALDQVR